MTFSQKDLDVVYIHTAAQAKAVATVDDGSTKDGTNALNWHRQHMAEC